MAALSRKYQQEEDRDRLMTGIVRARWRPSIAMMLLALLLIAALAMAFKAVQWPRPNVGAEGALTFAKGGFSVKPPAGTTTLTSTLPADAVKAYGARFPETIRRGFAIQPPPEAVFVKSVGLDEIAPAVFIRVLETEMPPIGEQQRVETARLLNDSFRDLFDQFTVGPAATVEIDSMQAAHVWARATRKLLKQPAETVYRSVAGGYEVAGRRQEEWLTLHTHFDHYAVRGQGRTYLITCIASEEQSYQANPACRTVTESFRALVRPPMLDPAPLQLFTGLVAVAILGLSIYLVAAIVQLLRPVRPSSPRWLGRK